jgi:UDP-N-acetylglucosamine/UDP-N-acetylgalactosamine diphosphorylase
MNETLIETFKSAGQGHVFAFWAELGAAERDSLLAQAGEIDLHETARLYHALVASKSAAGVSLDGLRPAPYEKLPEKGGDPARWAQARATGEAALRAGRVGVFTVAGGQGTRLGYDGPKGTFAVTPLRGKSLFQVFAEKILAAGRHYGRPLHWFIMTSHVNHGPTEAFFAEKKYFGLDQAHVHFFRQGRMPAVDYTGRILLETKSSIALSPDGHGGSLRALHRSGAIDLMQSAGVDTLSYFQVDNPLVRCIDPEFIGFHLLAGSEMSSKTAAKVGPEEKVGHFCLQNGRVCVIEYTDMPAAMQRETNADGSLKFGSGSIGIHVIDREFARRMAAGGEGVSLPFHRADKKIPTVTAAGAPVRPDQPNGVKFELFVFDALPFARNSIVIETARADDFSPVKNATGVDSPQTCRDDQLRQFARWLKAAGAAVPTDATGLPALGLEISPLFGYDAASFAEAWNQLPGKPEIKDGLYLG